MTTKKHTFTDLETNVLEKIIAQSLKGKVNTRTFYKAFTFIDTEHDEIRQFDTSKEVTDFLTEQGIPEDSHYKYIFTCVDGERDKLILLNGWHYCNRMFYVVSTKSWSTGNLEKDGQLYIEANY